MNLVIGLQVQTHAPAVVTIERLDDDGEADPAGRGHRAIDRAHALLLGHGQSGGGEEFGGQILVTGDVDREGAGLAGHGGADALLVHALPELDQAGAVEADEGDIAADGFLDDGAGRGPECRALGASQEVLQLCVPVETLLGRHQVVDQANRQCAGSQAHALVGVAVDHVVPARLALDHPGLTAALIVSGLLLQLQRDVLGDMPEPGAFAQPVDEATSDTPRAGVIPDPGKHLQELVGEAVNGVAGVALEHPEVDDEMDGGLIGPDIAAAVDAGFDDAQLGSERSCGGGALGHASQAMPWPGPASPPDQDASQRIP